MAEPQSPVICVTCTRPFSHDLKPDRSPRYFAQGPLLPRTDDAYDFGCEVTRILHHIKAIAEALRYGENKEVEPKTYDTLFELVGELSEEALRRLDLSLEAVREMEKREAEVKKALQVRKEGV